MLFYTTAIPQKIATVHYLILQPKTGKSDFIVSRSFVEML
jgi:hypothetical protein